MLDFDGNDIRLSYDGIDNLTEYRDNVQHVEYGYSGMWKLTRRRDHRGVVNFRYDREERLRRVTNEKLQSYEFTLDAVGNVTAEKGFDGAVRHYLRDRGGRVVRETLPSGTEREYGYDACSRVTRVSYPTAGDPDQTYAYGLSGRLVQASRGKARWSSRTTPWDFPSGRRLTATPYSAPTTIPAGYSRSTARRGPRCATPATVTGSLRGSRPPAAATPTAQARGNPHTATTRWASRWSASFREASSARSPTTT
ncbi:RHS repeat protein [Bacteroides fragilis]|nr:RHS repeat protein [Bacteroides fragilis]